LVYAEDSMNAHAYLATLAILIVLLLLVVVPMIMEQFP
jgi:hypothetical protein